MKLLHISDLHIGKKVKGYSLIDDQNYVLQQVLNVAKEKQVDGVIIAGDIYDSSTPSGEAINFFDKFISDIHSSGISCYAVSGNHDSIYRIAFGSDIMAKENIYFAKKYSGKLEPIMIDKDINIWLLPFIRPVDVRMYHPDFETGNYQDMMKIVLENTEIDTGKTNILVAHQFVTAGDKEPERSESETVSLGTLDNIDFSVFDKFDYVALGHIHKPQAMGKQTVRYAGSPLKYSFSEKNDIKSMVLIDISGKNVSTELIPYKALKDMREIVGTFEEISKLQKSDDYLRIVLKNENIIVDVKNKLENNFPNIMEIVYDNAYTGENKTIQLAKNMETQTPIELFKTFYELQNNTPMNEEQTKIVEDILSDMEANV